MDIERPGGTDFLAWLFAGFLVCMPLTASAGDDEWKFKAQAYGWLPTIESTLPNDDDLTLTIDDIFDYLDFTFMGVFQARKGDWAVVADAVYLKISPVRQETRPCRLDLSMFRPGSTSGLKRRAGS